MLGLGFWPCLVALPNQVVSAVPAEPHRVRHGRERRGPNAGGAIGSQLAAALIVSSAAAGTGAPAASGYIGALILCAAATGAGALAGLRHCPEEFPLTIRYPGQIGRMHVRRAAAP